MTGLAGGRMGMGTQKQTGLVVVRGCNERLGWWEDGTTMTGWTGQNNANGWWEGGKWFGGLEHTEKVTFVAYVMILIY